MAETPVAHSERAHSIMGGSRASIYLKCTGYFAMLKEVEKEEASPHADAGTAFHELMEQVVSDFLEHKITGSGCVDFSKTNPLVDAEMYQHADTCLNLLWEEGLDKHITGKAYGLEDYFSIATLGDIDIGGSIDFWCVYKDKKGQRAGLIVDWKYGYSYVDETKTEQLPFYATCMYEEFKRMGKKLDYIRAAICQPRAGGKIWREI